MSEAYDCTKDVMEHKGKVQMLMMTVVYELFARLLRHDDSKLKPPEKELFDEWTPKLRELKYGTEHYKVALDTMGPALQHHYQVNRHHPEHFENGVDEMTLMDVIEMVCDWMAAAEKQNVEVDLDHAAERFNLSPQLVNVIRNTVESLKGMGGE